eukprot:CAMPEP_0182556610 /NCGR_PEP_ID=MMETSP1324-20130603/816_1 /TAXON_ID=236786 /ORGANISM="Florenciella sp., Strain RCC1587" /LENGTH=243 /DNA_ID=CAMNT_0024768525 /DNA_START=282 /DNA_END=1012 /DNA_ORIENTATION=+
MNHVERRLPEFELGEDNLTEALQCLMHTIIFARWPLQSSTSNLAPREIECENFPIAYASCGESWVHQRVDEAIVEFKANLVPAGPELARGCLSLGFYERRHNKVVFWSYEEKVVWEEWVIPLLVNHTPHVAANERLSATEADRLQDSANAMYTASLQERMMEIFTMANGDLDHIPPSGTFDFEVSCQQADQREAVQDEDGRAARGGVTGRARRPQVHAQGAQNRNRHWAMRGRLFVCVPPRSE